MEDGRKYEAVAIGVSAGGMHAIKTILANLEASFDMPILIVQHIGANADNIWISLLQSPLPIKEADEKETIQQGTIYVAPANYHLLVNSDRTIALSIDARVNYARPSIDVLFESAAEVYGEHLIGVVLTGSNHDGTNGLKRIKEKGGLAVVQDPATAEARFMPASAIANVEVDYVLPLNEIGGFLMRINHNDAQNTNHEIYAR